MPSLNKAQIIGRLTRDPETRDAGSGKVTNFSVATDRFGGKDDSGQPKKFTDYHDCVAWNQGTRTLADIIAQFAHKGSLVYVEGRLQTRSWEDQQGVKKYRTEINCTDVQFLEKKGTTVGDDEIPSPASHAAMPAGVGAADSSGLDPDDIPF